VRGGPQQLRPPSNLRKDLWPQEDDPNVVPEEALLMPLLVQFFEWTPSSGGAAPAAASGGKASTGGAGAAASSYGYGGGIWPECEVRCAVGCLGLAATASPADAAAALGVEGLDRLLQLAELKVNLPGRSGRVREVAVTTISVLTPVANKNKSGDGGGGGAVASSGGAGSGSGGNSKNTVHLTPEDLAEETAELAEELQLAAVSARHVADEAIGAGLPGAEGLVMLANQADEDAQAADVKAHRAAKALATWQVIIEANFVVSFLFFFFRFRTFLKIDFSPIPSILFLLLIILLTCHV